MYRFLVVIELANNNYSADLPGCVATGATREEAEKNMYEAIEMHIQGLRDDNKTKKISRLPDSNRGLRGACAVLCACTLSILQPRTLSH